MTKESVEKEKLPEDPNQLVAQFRGHQQQMQSLLIQKESLKLQSLEVDKALEELEKTQQKNAYKIAGQIMISKPVDELKNELKEVKENIELRMKSLEKSEERTNNKLKEIQEKLKEMTK